MSKILKLFPAFSLVSDFWSVAMNLTILLVHLETYDLETLTKKNMV